MALKSFPMSDHETQLSPRSGEQIVSTLRVEVGTTLLIRIDCDPPSSAGSCDTTVQADQAFAGAALPASAGPALVIATHPQRALYRTELHGMPTSTALSPYTFPVEACGATCPPIIAVVVRDLDGDHALDVIAIDGDLQVYTRLAADNLQLRAALKIPTTPAAVLVASCTRCRTSLTTSATPGDRFQRSWCATPSSSSANARAVG